ncbi:MAG: hypothetical protein HOI95_17855 [Chromatiales bacterium]|nr:hypothetical protein [Chromatiales bacterium]
MTKGKAADQDRAVAWARDNGINFFDTAASYGDGASETNLGRALAGNTDGIVVSSKVGLREEHMADVAGAVRSSIDASLARLRLDHVDIFQLHNTLGRADHHGTLSIDRVLDDVIPAFEKLRDAGKTRFLGFTAKGEAGDLHKLIETEFFASAQIFYNLLVPSAGEPIPQGYPADDFQLLLSAAHDHGVGAIGVRVLAGGALTGTEARHPLGMPSVAPIGSNTDYGTDVGRALQFMPLVEAGHAATLPELAIRYVISNPILPTTEIGIATLEELQQAAAAVNKGPLSADALVQIKGIQAGFAA